MKKVLRLTLYRQWFDQILHGTKKIEYREIKPYWRRRLFNPDGSAKEFDKVIFTNGYGKLRPIMSVAFLGIREANGKYEILLGDVLTTDNL